MSLPDPMSVLVIFNPISGAGRARSLAEAAAEAARRRGIDVELLPTSPGPAETWLRGPIGGRSALVVVGGDGAVRLAAPEAARADVPLVHCPAGNENLFAREFGMTAAAADVANTLAEGSVRRVDLIRSRIQGRDDETVALMASFGFDAEVVHDLDSIRTGTVNNLSYVRPILRRMRAFDPPRITAIVDGTEVVAGVHGMVVVANSRHYASRLDPARRAVVDDGVIDLVVIPARSVSDLLGWMVRMRFGAHLRDPRLAYRTGRRIELRLEPPSVWQADGDPPRTLEPVANVTFDVDPAILPVLQPPRTVGDVTG
jgi:diacylglycerol kinase (ATP)